MKEHRKHQREALDRYQLLSESQKIKVGDFVRIRHTKPLIRKESAVFFPHTSESVFKVTEVKNQYLPYSYVLNDNTSKTYYGWSLVKVSPSILDMASRTSHNPVMRQNSHPTNQSSDKPVITVQNIVAKTDSKKLRSGKVLTHAFDMTYDILKDGERQFVDKETLKLYKRLFGSQILQYDETLLNDPEKAKHII